MISIAEESTAWPNVSRPVADGGLGFGFKWNMGFMNDTLRYLAHDPVYRSRHHDDITFGLLYAFSENFVLPLSHDEVVHGKGTLLGRMPGDDSQKFANLRAYYGFMWGYPGKKLLFMGQEFAQRDEWNESRALDWQLLDQPAHHGMRRLLGDLNRLYRTCPALHEWDCDQAGFSWSVADDRLNSVFAWLRFAPDAAPIAVIVNFTQVARHFYALSLPRAGPWREILNTDATIYGGGGIGNNGRVVAAADGRVEMTLPPLAAIMLEHEAEEPWH
jgi:1,4-alpha-glucan branching enzyme